MTFLTDTANMGNPGHYPRGFEWEALLDQVGSLTAPGWTAWTPSWTSDGTQPALGNGSIAGRYRRALNADLLIGTIRLLIGSTTTFGTLAYHFNLPVTMSASSQSDTASWGWAYDSSSTAIYSLDARIESSVWRIGTGGGSVVTPSVPFTWATSDVLCLNFAYEPA